MTEEKIIEYVIGYKPEIFKKDAIVFEITQDELEISINYLGMERHFYVEFSEWYPVVWKDDEEEDFYIPFTTEQLMKYFPLFRKINICKDCEGEGSYEQDTTHLCTRRMNDCCGGCSKMVECDCDNNSKIFPL
jgi:hypothetical protein